MKNLLALEFNSPFLRKVLSLKYQENHFYKVPFGKIRGSKLYYKRDVNYHAMLGLWENGSFGILLKLFRKFGLDRKNVVIADVGANIGYYSIFFSKYLQPGSRIFAFEPSTSILPVLNRNIADNQVSNVEVLDLACSDHVGTDEFFVGRHHHQSSLISEWANNINTGVKTVVSSVTLDYFFKESSQAGFPDLIKMDIEGGGKLALPGCEECILAKRPFILIESHTPSEDKAVSNLLLRHNYQAFRINTKEWVKNRENDYRDKQGVWGTMLLLPDEKKEVFTN